MEFNGYIWKLYRESAAGVAAIGRFSNLTPEFAGDDRLLEFESDGLGPDGKTDPCVIDLVNLIRTHAMLSEINSIEDAAKFYSDCVDGIAVDIPEFPEAFFRFGFHQPDWYHFVSEISLGLHLAHPQYYVPYTFQRRFDRFESICQQFGIPLPPVPGKGSKDARARYYGHINHALYEFRKRHDLSPVELCAFLYDFCEHTCDTDNVSDLPSPSKVWLVSGGTWDFEFVDNATDSSLSCWGGNPATRRGDIILLYCVAPRSHIHSIWRACSDGFADPFSHYHGNVAVGRPMKTVPVTYGEMSRHELLSKKPEIRAHLQGTGGKPFGCDRHPAPM